MAGAETQIIISAKDQASSVLRQIATTSKFLEGSLKGLGASFAGLVSVESLVSVYTETIKAVDSMGKLAQSTGLTVEQLSSYSYAARISGTDTESFASGLKHLSKNMADAASGNGQAIALFKTLGVNIKDAQGNLRPLDDVLGDIADKFAGWADGPAKVALAVQALGKSGNAMIPALNNGREGLRELSDEARNLGGVLTREMAEKAAKAQDSIERLDMAWKGFKISLSNSFQPAAGIDAVTKSVVGLTKAMSQLNPNSAPLLATPQGWNIAATLAVVKQVRQAIEGGSSSALDYTGPLASKHSTGKTNAPTLPDTDAITRINKLTQAARAAQDELTQLGIKAMSTSFGLEGDVAGAAQLNAKAEALKSITAVTRELSRIEDERSQLSAAGKLGAKESQALDAQSAALKAQIPIYREMLKLNSELLDIQERARQRSQEAGHAQTMAGLTGGTGVWEANAQAIAARYANLRENPATRQFSKQWDEEEAAAKAKNLEDQQVAGLQAARSLAQLTGSTRDQAAADMELLSIQRDRATTTQEINLRSAELAEAQARRDGDMAAGAQKGFRTYAQAATDGFSQASAAASESFSIMSSGFSRAIVLGEGLGSTLQNLSLRLTDMVLEMNFMGPLAKMFSGASASEAGGFLSIFSAKGNVFQSADLAALSGTVVSRPTAFGFQRRLTPFATGGGVMGEAGPEAILPLFRGSGGYLGVKSQGAQSAAPVFNISATFNVQGSSGNAATDDRYLKNLEAMMRRGIKTEIADALREAQRPGGQLHGGNAL